LKKKNNKKQTMEKKIISNHSELMLRIAELNMHKDIQELELQESFRDIISSLNLVSLFKQTENQERPFELAGMSVNLVVDLIIDLILGKHRSLKGYLSAVLVEKFSNMLINNNIMNIISGFKSLFTKK
jgi:hypothetical protein